MSDAATADRSRGALLGLAVGDALGTTLEFTRRDAHEPLMDMVGGGPFQLPPGYWTDDTSMALCLAESLLADPSLDPADLMDRFVRWWRDGENSPTGACFDIGNMTASALRRYEATGDPWQGEDDPTQAGNGSLMRLAPVAILAATDASRAAALAVRQSRVTHGAPQAVAACAGFARMLVAAIAGGDKETVLAAAGAVADPTTADIFAGSWRGRPRRAIASSGYVAHTLEAALWCFERTSSFDEAVLLAANLADDADTVAAVCGQVAGAYYGRSGIRPAWLERIAWADRICGLADDLRAAAGA